MHISMIKLLLYFNVHKVFPQLRCTTILCGLSVPTIVLVLLHLPLLHNFVCHILSVSIIWLVIFRKFLCHIVICTRVSTIPETIPPFGVPVIHNVILSCHDKVGHLFPYFLHINDCTKRLANVGLAQTRPNDFI